MKIKPIGNKVTVEVVNEIQKTKSGIIMPDQPQEMRLIGTIVELGEGKYDHGSLIPISVEKGDRVVFRKPWEDNSKYQDGDKKMYLVDVEDIFGVVLED